METIENNAHQVFQKSTYAIFEERDEHISSERDASFSRASLHVFMMHFASLSECTILLKVQTSLTLSGTEKIHSQMLFWSTKTI